MPNTQTNLIEKSIVSLKADLKMKRRSKKAGNIAAAEMSKPNVRLLQLKKLAPASMSMAITKLQIYL